MDCNASVTIVLTLTKSEDLCHDYESFSWVELVIAGALYLNCMPLPYAYCRVFLTKLLKVIIMNP